MEVWLLVTLAAGLRLYRLAEYTTFQGDQGLDALAARRLLVDHVLPLEGPATSAGGVHLGPLYYYLLAGPMLVSWLDPLADAVLMAVLGALAVGLVYVLARGWFGRPAAVAAATLMAVSPAVIEASRSAWNPAPAPFFVLVALGGLEGFRRQGDGRWLVLVGAALSCVIQLHYFTLGLVLVLLAVEVFLLCQAKSGRATGWALVGLGLGAALLAPWLVHEIASGFPNVQAAIGLAGGSAGAESLPRRMYAVLVPTLIGGFLTAGVEPLAIGVALALVVGLALSPARYACLLLTAGLLVIPLQAVLYRGPIPAHYVLAYAPVAYLAVGAAVSAARRYRVAVGLAVLGLVVVNVANAPFGVPAGQLARSEEVARAIDGAAGGERFGLWFEGAGDSDGAYRFQLARRGRPPVDPAEALPGQVFVVCQARPCDLDVVRSSAGPEWAASRNDWSTQVADVHIARLTVR